MKMLRQSLPVVQRSSPITPVTKAISALIIAAGGRDLIAASMRNFSDNEERLAGRERRLANLERACLGGACLSLQFSRTMMNKIVIYLLDCKLLKDELFDVILFLLGVANEANELEVGLSTVESRYQFYLVLVAVGVFCFLFPARLLIVLLLLQGVDLFAECNDPVMHVDCARILEVQLV
eukprot:GEZU01025085.1.p1 GENE.GEZU01025085.1~~GEZU01025085.1.p1  ORF type:complete len:180 (+),score=17.71 GEZU01025085.1:58-597(+)